MWKLIILLITVVGSVEASAGDRSWTFVKCFQECKEVNCTTEDQLAVFSIQQPKHLQFLGWDCVSECKYVCMWKAVDDFRKDGIPQQQYFGKWPFIRVFGVQEPASSLFSVLNGVSHVVMLMYFRRHLSPSAPLFYFWHLYSLVNVNTWFWSTIFHIRDTNFTEMMDYFCAIFLVLTSLFAACLRLSYPRHHRLVGGVIGLCLLSYFAYHVHYLAFVHFDYGYNMIANVTVGVINAIVWVGWCFLVRKKQPYVRNAYTTISLLSLLIFLEMADFQPFFWTIDAHSLWHLGTIVAPLWWYRFLVDDCTFLMKEKLESDGLVDIPLVITKKTE